jgi:dihydropteroate synthase
MDTSKPDIMRVVLDLGVDIINDITALGATQSRAGLSRHDSAGVCLMHTIGSPQTMQSLAVYGDVVSDVRTFLAEAIRRARESGIHDDRLVIDPGYGLERRSSNALTYLPIKAAYDRWGVRCLSVCRERACLGR